MTVMGLSSDIQQHVLHIVAGVLHLGNIDFVEKNNYADIANRQCTYAVPSSHCQFTLRRDATVQSRRVGRCELLLVATTGRPPLHVLLG